MPKAGGLDDVTQKIGVDSSEAVKGYENIVPAADKASEANDKLMRSMKNMQDELRILKGELDDFQDAMTPRGIEQWQRVIAQAKDSAGDFGDAHNAAAPQIEVLRNSIEGLGESYAKLSRSQYEALDASKMSWTELHGAIAAAGDVYSRVQNPVNDINTELHKQVAVISTANDALEKHATIVGKVVDAYSRGQLVTGGGGGIVPVPGAGWSYGGGGPGMQWTLKNLGPVGGGGGYVPPAAALGGGGGPNIWGPAMWGPHGGGGGIWGPMPPGWGAGGGGGGGGGAGFAAALANWFHGGGGGATTSFNPMSAAGGLGAVRFWGMMSAEILSTVVPASVAAGAAALVGLQGGQQLANRYNAIATTAESLGGAFGKTTGSVYGIGSSLQQYQNAGTGGVYELAGAGINFLKGGGGQGMLAQGLNTIAMLDRGVANISPDLGRKLTSLMGGGTGYLRQFGDIGANLGNTILNAAPNLPGVGADLLSSLTGMTGAVSAVSGAVPSTLMKSFLTYEAASRWGPALAGGQGLIGKMLGLDSGGWGLGKFAAAGKGGLGGLIARIPGLGGLGGAIADLSGPEIGIPLAGMQLEDALLNRYIPSGASGVAQKTIAGLQSQVAAGGFSGAWNPLATAITKTTGLKAAADAIPWAAPTKEQLGSRIGVGVQAAYARSPQEQYAKAAEGFTTTMGNLVDSGPQLVTALHKAGLKGVSMADAFQIAQNSLLDLSHAFDSHGNLTKTAKNMLSNYVSTIAPMTQNAGAFGAAMASQTIMGSEAMKDLSGVNQAMDSMTTIMTGTALGASGLSASGGALTPAVAKALGSVTAPGAAAAWNTFASTSTTAPGVITQLQSFNDQMRTNLTLGTSTAKQASGMTGYEIQNAVKALGPGLKKDPAAIASLMQQAAQQGIGGYYQGGAGNAAANYAALEKSLKGSADSAKQMNADSTAATIKNSQLPTVAKQFVQGTSASIQSQQIAKAAQDAVNIKSGINVKVNASDIVSQLKAAGVQGGAALKSSLDSILKQAGVGGAQRIKIEASVQGISQVQDLKNQISQLKDKEVTAKAHADSSEVASLQRQIAALQNKVVTITTVLNTVRMTSSNNPYAGGISGRAGMASGGMVPGFGSGDHVPALLEPGEAIVPKYLVPLIAPILRSHHVPGFAAGGIVPAGTAAGIQAQINAQYPALDALYGRNAPKSQIDAFWKTVLDPLYAAKDKLAGTTTAVANAATSVAKATSATAKATADANKIATSINYARSVSNASVSGLNIAGMSVDSPGSTGIGAVPPGHPGYNAAAWNAATTYAASNATPLPSVQDQMSSYLSSIKAFSGDLGVLGKKGLNKGILQQLIGAGPVQGDALAQSILGGSGGVGGVNSLFKQIQAASRTLGGTAAGAVYGGHPTTSGGQLNVGGINININVGGGGGSGGVSLTTAQIKTITAQVQAALLKQAKTNRQTGIKLPGRGA